MKACIGDQNETEMCLNYVVKWLLYSSKVLITILRIWWKMIQVFILKEWLAYDISCQHGLLFMFCQKYNKHQIGEMALFCFFPKIGRNNLPSRLVLSNEILMHVKKQSDYKIRSSMLSFNDSDIYHINGGIEDLILIRILMVKKNKTLIISLGNCENV